MSGFDWEAHNRRAVLEGREVLERTSSSIARSNQIAIETEETGTEILSELDSQRETLLRSSARLENVNDGLHESGKITRLMTRAVLYNKLVLILIITLETFILIGLIYYKFIQK